MFFLHAILYRGIYTEDDEMPCHFRLLTLWKENCLILKISTLVQKVFHTCSDNLYLSFALVHQRKI